MKFKSEILNILYLLIGVILTTLSGINWHIGIAAWIGPVFLLMYTRRINKWYQYLIFFVVFSISGAVSQTNNNLLNIPAVNVFNGLSFGIFMIIPYVIDKLLYKQNDKFYYTLIFPSSIALLEFVVSLAIGAWGSIAHTQYEFKPFMQLGTFTGIYGIWFIISWFAAVVNWVIENKVSSKAILKSGLVFGSVFILIVIFGLARLKINVPVKQTIKVAAISSDLNLHEFASNESDALKELATDFEIEIPGRMYSDSFLIETMLNRTKNAANQGAKIIVWNEGALILSQAQKKSVISKIQSISSANEAYILLAFLEECAEENKKPFNNVGVFISSDGDVVWDYKKSFLQPTAEAPIINKGDYELPITKTRYGNVGNVICADLDMQKYIRQAGDENVDILLVPSFDWPGITPLHSEMASIEAIQFGCAIVRANGRGISAVFDYKGNELASLNTLTSNEKILFADLPIQSVKTIYTRTGNLLIFLCFGFLIFIVVRRFLCAK
jgi:apolipoprotein N-acyltransferase